MAGMSLWGPGSEVGDQAPFPPQQSFMNPMMPGTPGGYGNPFATPAPSEFTQLRSPTMFGPYGQSPLGGPLGGGVAPRNSFMSGLGGYGLGGMNDQNRMSSFSLATTANPFGGGAAAAGPPLVPNENSNPGDDEVLGVLRRYLATQDLMTV